MLNWENFVIQQEKMQKLREDIFQIANASESKLRKATMKSLEMK